MKNALVPAFVFVLLASGCASTQPHYPIEVKTYAHDTIHTQSAIDLAYASYLRACTDRYTDLPKPTPDTLMKCKEKAQAYIKDDVIFILDRE